jgi:hypothetical protein
VDHSSRNQKRAQQMMISKMWYICAMEYYLPVKKNRIASFAGK